MKKQLIIIPAYQPLESLVPLTKDIFDYFENVLVIDDGGGEKYAHIFTQLKDMGAIIVTHAINQGKGRALKSAINYCLLNPEIAKAGVITVDADGQHRPADIVKVAEAMEQHPDDVVLGCREFDVDNVPWKSRMGNGISRKVYKWTCGIDVTDTQTGLRGLPYSFLEIAARCDGEKYEYETNMLLDIKTNKVNITEVTIQTVYENNNESSHFNPVRDSIRIYSIILKYSFASLFSALIDYIIFIIAHACGAKIMMATYIARACSCLINFTLNKNVVFQGKGNSAVQLAKYLVLVVISGTISGWSVTHLSALLPMVAPVIIKVPVEIILYLFNYTVQRTLIFSDKE
ncbi:bifunctional glycosyltransferase family 2/GtrA family protein [Pseudobutyrivibrio xylanivorans]|uniref:Putative flippase GtrA (Transmembrane translocase of bactoprenol-linked glucose) n=1 Tax=Pseudobutyrivibrio xylanivorans DSM 14809 TaxID=1123012 RepID=A0A1M6JSB0_PSEXY|nr:bifunctional glycosyltransferase family 2/GtrA family protein [Pseudobutyrivibrio xylanivorans]SHJ49500.1 Putative flippase GtrA (transmembrane translocase of bactoprenol-linked glucose) [Pseudobutyrivibrio xylanivorans DSM 14809]